MFSRGRVRVKVECDLGGFKGYWIDQIAKAEEELSRLWKWYNKVSVSHEGITMLCYLPW